MKKSHVTLALGLIAGVVFGYYFGHDREQNPTEDTVDPTTEETAAYSNPDLGLSFTYRQDPDGYVLIEPTELPYEDAEKVINLFKQDEWEEFEESEEPREGPPGISITVFSNGELTTEEWIESHEASNYVLGGNLLVAKTVGGISGIEYNWSGLYEGRSVVLSKDDQVFLFSVTYLDTNDGLRDDFEELLDSVTFSS